MSTSADRAHAELCERERRLLDPAVRSDSAALGALLHPEFVELGASGRVWTRSEIIAALADDPGEPVDVSEMTASEVVQGAVLLTYTVTRPHRRTLRSSLWVLSSTGDVADLGWRLRFHQGTVVPRGDTERPKK